MGDADGGGLGLLDRDGDDGGGFLFLGCKFCFGMVGRWIVTDEAPRPSKRLRTGT